MNQDHSEIRSTGEVYFDENRIPSWNHQRSLKSEQTQLQTATDLIIQWQPFASCMHSDRSSLSSWTVAHLCQDFRFCLTFTNILDILPRSFFFFFNGNAHSQNYFFTSTLFFWAVADIIKERLTIAQSGQHLEKQVSSEECKGGLK